VSAATDRAELAHRSATGRWWWRWRIRGSRAWLAWSAVAAAIALGGGLPRPVVAAAVVALAGGALAAPRGQRAAVLVVLAAVAVGEWRAAGIDRAARPVSAQTVTGAPMRLIETLPAHGPATPNSGGARAVWRGRVIVLTPARYGRPTPLLRRGTIATVSGPIMPLGRGAGDRRLARQGVAGRLLVSEARDTGRRRGGLFGAIDGMARDAASAMHAAGGPRDGALLAGMALGNAEEVTEEDRDALRAAGLWHLAAASGGNVALVVALAMLLGWLAGLPDPLRLGLAAIAIAGYVPLAGAGPSIQRAGVMGIAALAALAAGREHRTADALGLAAAATLVVDPRAWMDVGWQLSFAATAGLLLAVGPGQRRLRRAGVPRLLAAPLATTLAATLATAPIMLATFGSVSAIGLLTNLAAAPAAAITVWSGALTALVAPWSSELARLIAEPGAVGAGATLALAGWGAGRPHAEIGAAAVAVVLVGAAIMALLRPGAPLTLAAGIAIIGWVALSSPRAPTEPRLVVLDIGQGSAALLQDGPDAVLVDAGPIDGGVVAQLRRAGVQRLRAMVLSHPAADHDGGGAAVLRAFPTDLVLDGGAPGGGPTHAAAMREAERRSIRVVPVRAGQRMRVGRLSLWIRWPTPSAAHRPGDPNDRAAVVQAQVGALRALIPADAEGNVLRRLPRLAADVLVVSHHGSTDPALPQVLQRLRPRAAVISVGAGNTYGHPTRPTLGALRRAAVPTLRTDQAGSVDLRVSSGRLVIRRSGQ
jgi:competence protein ComEC